MPSTPYATGKIAIYGANGTITLTGSGIIGSTNIATQGLSLEQTAEAVELENGDGQCIAKHYHSPKKRCTVEFIPYDAISGTLATLNASVFLPAPGSQVAIASATLDVFEGNWNFTGRGSIRPNRKGYAVVSMELERAGESSGEAAYLTPG